MGEACLPACLTTAYRCPPLSADRMSFEFVLRKKGSWAPFPQQSPSYLTGRALYCRNQFIGPPNMPPPKGDEAIPCPTA